MEVLALHLPLFLLFGTWAQALGSDYPEVPLLFNEDVKRTVDLSSHLAKVTAEVVLAHPGGGSTSRATSFLLALEPELETRLAHLGVQVSGAGLCRSKSLSSEPGRRVGSSSGLDTSATACSRAVRTSLNDQLLVRYCGPALVTLDGANHLASVKRR